MSVHGNKPGPYTKQGTAQCLASIDAAVSKLRVIFAEQFHGTIVPTVEYHLREIEFNRGWLSRWAEEIGKRGRA